MKRGFQVHSLTRNIESAPAGTQVHTSDVRDRKTIQTILSKIAPELDCLIINAGVGYSLNPRHAESAEKAAEIIDVNVTAAISAAYSMAHEWIRLGLKGKRIVFISSLAAGRGLPRNEVYIASKTALVSFCQGFERDLEKHGIDVTLVLPGFIDTDMTKDLSNRPFLMTGQEAARCIFDGIEKGKTKIAFPKEVAWLAKIRDGIPYSIFHWIVIQLQKRKVL
jgi:short-subunit dehydrogenase